MTFNEALRRLDLSQINSLQLVVLEAAVAAMLKSHPDAAAVRREFDSLYPKMQTAAGDVFAGEDAAVPIVASHLRDRIFEEKGLAEQQKREAFQPGEAISEAAKGAYERRGYSEWPISSENGAIEKRKG